MQLNEIVITSRTWVVGFSTSIYNKITGIFLNIDFVRRNLKSIIVYALIWIITFTGSYLIYHGAVGRLKNKIFKQGVSITTNLAKKSSLAILGDDLLSLNTDIDKLSRRKKVQFVTILDHKNKILAHTNIDKVNQTFKPFKTIDHETTTIEGVLIDCNVLFDNKKVLFFSTPINFSELKIGMVYYVISARYLNKTLSKYTALLVTEFVLSLLLLSLILFFTNRSSKAEELKARKRLEDTNQIGPYRLIKNIARGGMAELFLADYERRDGFKRIVAIKRVLPHLSGDKNFVKMFIREARLAALLQHPNIVQIIDFGKIQNAYFIAMDYIRGKNLAEIMSSIKKGLPVDQSVFIVTQTFKGLEFAHSKKDDKTKKPLGIVHRDISPQNILISFLGEIKITDFGISKASSEPNLTQAGEVKGKILYMSPEQSLGKEVNAQTDIYALGIIFYELLSGKRLYHFTSSMEASRSIRTIEIKPINKLRPDIPDELNRIVMKCLEKDKSLRYQSSQDVYDDLISLKKSLNMTYDSSNLSIFMKTHFKEEEI
ncbi:MAG: protein kinase [Desulfosarcina sp.]|nr:protein kinase [Desulfobacterales bacterium]